MHEGGALRTSSLRSPLHDQTHERSASLYELRPGNGYESLRRRADRFDLGGLSVLVASIDDLIAMKSATGRPKDRAAVDELEALKRLSTQGAASR